jgi:hypothetical protein
MEASPEVDKMSEKSMRVMFKFVGIFFCISKEAGEVNGVMRPGTEARSRPISGRSTDYR